MFPSPYLGAIGPDATPGSVVYRLSARQRDGTLGRAQFFLLEGEWLNSYSNCCIVHNDYINIFHVAYCIRWKWAIKMLRTLQRWKIHFKCINTSFIILTLARLIVFFPLFTLYVLGFFYLPQSNLHLFSVSFSKILSCVCSCSYLLLVSVIRSAAALPGSVWQTCFFQKSDL